MKKYLLLFFTILLSLSQYTTTAQTTLFSDDFGAPGDGVKVRNTWSYMATGGNAFVFAGPNAPNMGGQIYSETKAIENNFYAVVGPKYIYSSVRLSPPSNMEGVYEIWTQLVTAGDATPGHNGDGGALVVNAGTTLSSIYSRETGLQAGKYYKLSYKLFVEHSLVKINHVILSPSGITEMAKHMSPDNGQGTGTWKQQEYWFYVPTGCSPGEYGITIYNANANDLGNDFAIDDVLFQSYETADVPEDVKGTTAVAEIGCAIPEPIAKDDTVTVACSGAALTPVTFSHNGDNDILKNDSAQENTPARSNVSINLIVPPGASNTVTGYGEWATDKRQTITLAGQGVWVLTEGRTVAYDDATKGPKTSGFPRYELKFTPDKAFTADPTPLQYTITNLQGGSAIATINLLYACNPTAVDDSATMTVGTPVTVTILDNDTLANATKAIATNVSVGLINPYNPLGTPTTSVTIPGEGVWTYDDATGGLTFTPESGFTSDPKPIQYKITGNASGRTSAPTTVTVTVATTPPLTSDLAIVKTVDKVTPNVGDNVIFTLTATNNGPDDNTLVQVQDLLPSGYSFVSTTATETTYNSTTGLWNIGSLNKANSRSITITAKATDVNNYTNTATISGENTDSITTNNVATASIISAINCSKAGISGNSMLDNLQFLSGTGSATDIKLDDYLLRPNSFNIGGTKYDVVLKIETLEFRGAGRLEIAPATSTLVGNLQLAGVAPINNPYVVYKFSVVESGSATASNPTGTAATITRMWVTLSDIDGNGTTQNLGDVSGYSLSDVPAGVIIGSNLENKGLQTGNPTGFNLYRPIAIPGLNVDALAFTNAVQMYYDNFSSGSFLFGVTGTNTAVASRAQVAYIRSEVVCDANLAIEKTVDNKTPNGGSTVTFTLKATNAGPSDATNVVVVDNVPAGYTVTTVTPSVGTWTAPNWTIGNLANGATATLTVVATVNATGSYLNKATISGGEKDPNLTDNEDEETITSKQRTKLITNPMIYQKVK